MDTKKDVKKMIRGLRSVRIRQLAAMLDVTDIRTGKPMFVRPAKTWAPASMNRLLKNVLEGTMVVALVMLGACRQEGLFPAEADGSVGDDAVQVIESPDVQTWAVDNSVDIRSISDLSVADLPREGVDKGGDEVQPPDLRPLPPDLAVIDTLPDLSPPQPDLAVPDTMPDLMTKKDTLLGPGQTCKASNECQQGHCSTLTGRCCQTACLDTGCGLGCGPDGQCIACQFCTCTNGSCHC
jgi:hypothetical protein